MASMRRWPRAETIEVGDEWSAPDLPEVYMSGREMQTPFTKTKHWRMTHILFSPSVHQIFSTCKPPVHGHSNDRAETKGPRWRRFATSYLDLCSSVADAIAHGTSSHTRCPSHDNRHPL